MKRMKKVLILLTLLLMTSGTMTVCADTAVRFNKTNSIALKKKKSRKGKLSGLTKKQKKKNWSFSSSDNSIAKVKRNGKYGYIITAGKKKDGYAVIQAKEGKTIVFLLVKVGAGTYISNRTRQKVATALKAMGNSRKMHNAWNILNSGTGTTATDNPAGIENTVETDNTTEKEKDDFYDQHPGWFEVPASYGAVDNRIVFPPEKILGKDKNGFDYGSVRTYNNEYYAYIGRDRNGNIIKAARDPISFSLEAVSYMDEIYNQFDNGYYKSLAGTNTFFSDQPVYIKIKTTGSLDTEGDLVLHEVTARTEAIQGELSYCFIPNNQYDPTSIGFNNNLTGSGLYRKLSDGYLYEPGSSSTSAAIRLSVTIDGVTKTIDYRVMEVVEAFNKWYSDKLDSISGAQALARYSGTEVYNEVPEELKIIAGKVNTVSEEIRFCAVSEDRHVLQSVPAWIMGHPSMSGKYDCFRTATAWCTINRGYVNIMKNLICEKYGLQTVTTYDLYDLDSVKKIYPQVTGNRYYYARLIVKANEETPSPCWIRYDNGMGNGHDWNEWTLYYKNIELLSIANMI